MLDLVVARDAPEPAKTADPEQDDVAPGQREVAALGRAVAGRAHAQALRELEGARADLGRRAQRATLVVVAEEHDDDLRREAAGRGDVALVDPERLLSGS